ncbi:MAG: 50S ribosome-binding GTPase [Kosmotogaceae bacterium]|nr:50S ribosome-binding GTPase [Kosmotogaceae bacterium]
MGLSNSVAGRIVLEPVDERVHFVGEGEENNAVKGRLGRRRRYRYRPGWQSQCGENSGFNALRGMHQKIGNWPGVTIEKKEGVFSFAGIKAKVVDLPGIYGLNAFSLDERISRDYLVTSKPDLVLSIIDSTNLQRNLYLALELIEMGMNIIVVLNMQDELEAKNTSIDTEGMARELGVPVVMISALKRTGIKDLKDKIMAYRKKPRLEQIVGFTTKE